MESNVKILKKYGCMPKHHFIKEYKKYDEVGARKVYFDILLEISNSVVEENIRQMEKLSELVACISYKVDIKILQEYFSESDNLIGKTNFVILSCKYGKVKSLKFILENDINLVSICNATPCDVDDDGRNAFYYAIRSSNIDLLETLIEKWPGDHFKKNPEELDDLLAQSYEELKLKNVLLSEEMNIFIESSLIDLRFYTNTRHNATETSSLKNIKERVELLLKIIKELISECSISKIMDEKKLHILKFIAQNIHILKRQLKSTYDKLPWEEMEFYIVMFVISRARHAENNLIYRYVLGVDNLLNYLEYFAQILGNLDIQSYGTSFDGWNNLPELERATVIGSISENCSVFENLYKDYEKIMDVYALEKIYEYIEAATSSSASDKSGQLVIARALQILGEYLKNTLESPKLSSATSGLLLLTLPQNTRRIVTDLRNALSHSGSLIKRKELEESEDAMLFSNIQNDIEKINVEIVDLLFHSKIKILRELLLNLSQCENLLEIKVYTEVIQDVNFDNIRNMKIRNYGITQLIEELKETIKDTNGSERMWFDQINKLLKSKGNKIESSNIDYSKGLAFLTGLKRKLDHVNLKECSMRLIKFEINKALDVFHPTSKSGKLQSSHSFDNLVKIAYFIKKISESATMRMKSQEKIYAVEKLQYRFLFALSFETGDVRWIQDLRDKLRKIPKNTPRAGRNGKNCKMYNKELEQKLQILKNVLGKYVLNGKLTEKILAYKKEMKQQVAFEMVVLDVLSILGTTRKCLKDNLMFLDINSPILMGRNLRNHLAHGNALFNISPFDPSNAIFLNAVKFSQEDLMKRNKKIGTPLKDNAHKAQKKYAQQIKSIENQILMFKFLTESDLEKVIECIKSGADINARDVEQWTALHFAAKGSDIKVLEYVLDQNISINARDSSGKTALHIAARYGRENLVECLLKQDEALLMDTDLDGKTALHVAAQNGFVKVVEVLLKYGADCTFRNQYGESPLYCAIFNNGDIAKIMLKKVDDWNTHISFRGFTSLEIAAEVGDYELVRYLLDRGADVQVRSDTGLTPLHTACLFGHIEVVELLIYRGADVNARLHDGCTPLHYAVEEGFEKVVDILIKCGARIDVVSKERALSPMLYAAKYGHARIAELLIKKGADVNIRTSTGDGALHAAAYYGHTNIAHLLLKTGKVGVNAKNICGQTALHVCSIKGSKDTARLLLENGADHNALDNNDISCLLQASCNGRKEMVEILIEYGANINGIACHNNSLLCLAAQNGHVDVVKMLLELGAFDNINEGLLYGAVQGGDIEIINVLIDNGADVNSRDANGMTPLHLAALYGHTQIVHRLIQNCGNVNSECIERSTPLHCGVKGNHNDIVKMLIENGANVDDISVSIAISNNNKDIVNILLKSVEKIQASSVPYVDILQDYKNVIGELLRYTDKEFTSVRVSQFHKETWLHIAAMRGFRKIVDILLDNGIKVDSLMKVDYCDITPLFVAVVCNHIDVVELLVKRGANVNFQFEKIPVLHIAAGQGFVDIVRTLLVNGAKPNTQDWDNRTAIEFAVGRGHLEIVKILLEYRDINSKINNGDDWALLHIAAQMDQLKCTEYLVEMGADIDARNCSGSKPIHIAARDGHKDIVEFYLKINEDMINDLGKCNCSLLHYSCATGQLEIVKYLIEKGAEVNASEFQASKPLHFATIFGHKDTVDVLLNNGAFYNSVNSSNQTPLDVARIDDVRATLLSCGALFKYVKSNNYLKVEKCVSDGVCVNVKNAENVSVLHYAAWKGYESITNILLKNGANPNIIGKGDSTPLHYASKFGHYEIVRSLLSHNAMYDLKNSGGKTPLDLTNERDIVKLLTILKNSFLNIKNRNVKIILDLKSVTDICSLKAIMKAHNADDKSLIVAAMHNNFPKIKELREILLDVSPYTSIANTLLFQEKYDQALAIYETILDVQLESLGPNDPGTLDVRDKISAVLFKQQKYKRALTMNEDILKIQKKILGVDHQNTLRSRGTIALILTKLEKNEEALRIYEEIHAKQKGILDRDHEDIMVTENHMAIALDQLGRYEEALILNRTIYQREEKSCGANHPKTLSTKNNIALVLYKQNKYEESLKIYREVYEVRKKILGLNHSDTLRTLYNKANVYASKKKYDVALEMFQKLYQRQKNALGPTHQDTLNTQLSMAYIQLQGFSYITAYQNFKEVLEPLTIMLGSDHPTVLHTQKCINIIDEIFSEDDKRGSDYLNYMRIDMLNAACNGDIKMIRHLVKNGIDVNHADTEGKTALHFAISNKHANAVEILLKSGADCTLCTSKGNTPLHIAVCRDDMIIAKMLLCHVKETSIDKLERFVNTKTSTGKNTALHVAVNNNNMEMVKILLQYGATYNAADRYGKTPLDLSANKDIAAFLKLIQELFQNVNDEILVRLQNLNKDELLAVANARNIEGNTLLIDATVKKYHFTAQKFAKIFRMSNQ